MLEPPEVGLARGGSSTANLSEPKNPSTLESSKGLVVCLKVISRDSFTFVRKRASKVSRVLCTRAGWFKHSEPHRTYTSLTNTELARCVGCFCTRAGWFKHSEPPRNDTNHTITELARCVGCLGTRSGWFKHSEPTRTTQSQS